MNSNPSLEEALKKVNEIDVSEMAENEALEYAGRLIDYASDTKDTQKLNDAFLLLDEISKRDITDIGRALMHYFRANAWAAMAKIECTPSWKWEQNFIQKQILELRSAVFCNGFDNLQPFRRCQILTNLGIQLNTIGRFIEAVETWNKALAINKNFVMALGNRGNGLSYYARSLYDEGHAGLFMLEAHTAFTKGIVADPDATVEDPSVYLAMEAFAMQANEIAHHVPIDKIASSVNLDNFSLGDSELEISYRKWCLSNKLFLNPLNDIYTRNISAIDVLMLPPITGKMTETYEGVPRIFGLFNQMKQEFSSARFLFFEAQENIKNDQRSHFSDKDVELYDTLDYPVYGLNFEKMRMAYRAAYSIFDKIGFFLNSYMELDKNNKTVNFRNVWYTSKRNSQELISKFEKLENWPLRGLFWVSKDFFDRSFSSTTAPNSEELADIRNHLEHKYLQLHDSWCSAVDPDMKSLSKDVPALDLPDFMFQQKTIELLKLTRNAMIYLSLAVHIEERTRNRGFDQQLEISMHLQKLDDERKQ